MICALRRLPRQLGRLPTPTPTPCTRTIISSRCLPVRARAQSPIEAWTTRAFSSSPWRGQGQHDDKAQPPNQKGLDQHEQEVRVRRNQVKRPWLREDADKPPAEKPLEQQPPDTKGNDTMPTNEILLLPADATRRQAPHHAHPPPQVDPSPPHPRRKGQEKQ